MAYALDPTSLVLCSQLPSSFTKNGTQKYDFDPIQFITLTLSYILFNMTLILLCPNATVGATFGFTNETDKQALLAISDQILEDPFNVLRSWNDSIHFSSWKGVTCSHRHQRETILNLSSRELVGSLSPHMGNLTFLRGIHLENDSFRGTIPLEIGRLFRLQHLSLDKNSFQGEFPTNLTHCSGITVINMSSNNLLGKIPIELGSLSNLLELRLSKNLFIGNIPPSLGNLSALRTLDLGYNNLEGSIPFELGKLSDLQCSLSGRLPKELGLTLPKLQYFLVGGNQFSGPIPPSLVNATELVKFDIGENFYSGSVPMNLHSLQNLDRLSIFSNRLRTKKANDLSFLDSLTNCSNLQGLLLGGNYFGGVLPNSIANLSTSLTSLSINVNYISGSIPQGIGNLVNLEFLVLDTNMFSGSIPESNGKISKLQ
ncbi:LRR receptor-like serine/threonine-protein kinase EFR [Cornus florida]|uniref:LRR receptor-like serine/threonine-protein kinase EFR n=1 Tax=Cornus florida TaxID=4283 RepID=UPI0028974171|nr:LRR receptor-like serine/threonine-protein kinase EFR [Cornus florida]